MEPAQSSSSEDGARSDAQLFLAQLHGALHRIVVEDGAAEYWPSQDRPQEWDRLVAAYLECEGFGAAQDALNSGEHDEDLTREALTGNQGAFKFGGWRTRLRDFYNKQTPRLGWARRLLGWAGPILDSLAAIPGIGQIKEIVGLLDALLSEADEGGNRPSTASGAGD